MIVHHGHLKFQAFEEISCKHGTCLERSHMEHVFKSETQTILGNLQTLGNKIKETTFDYLVTQEFLFRHSLCSTTFS